MHNAIAHHPEPDAQPVLAPRSLVPSGQLPQLYTEHDVIWYGISPWIAWLGCPGCAPSQLLVKINSISAEPRTLSYLCSSQWFSFHFIPLQMGSDSDPQLSVIALLS